MDKIYQHSVVDANLYKKIPCKSDEPIYSRTLPSGTNMYSRVLPSGTHIILSNSTKHFYKANGTGISRVGVKKQGSLSYELKDCWIMKHGRTKEGKIQEFLYKRVPESVVKTSKIVKNIIAKILPANIAEAMKISVAKGK